MRWRYEPDTFPIGWTLDGEVVESFSPDFYLPDLDLYVELTTLKQSLVRKKNRKLRRLRELYPDVRIKLFYARDFRQLLLKFGRLALAEELSGTTGQATPPRVHAPAATSLDGAADDGVNPEEAAAALRPAARSAATPQSRASPRSADAAAGAAAALRPGPQRAPPSAPTAAGRFRRDGPRAMRHRPARAMIHPYAVSHPQEAPPTPHEPNRRSLRRHRRGAADRGRDPGQGG